MTKNKIYRLQVQSMLESFEVFKTWSMPSTKEIPDKAKE